MQIISARTRHILILFYIALAVAGLIMISDQAQRFESDPLTVTGGPDTVGLNRGDFFVFEREVCTTADLDVTVHREFHDLSTGQKYMIPGIRYVAYARDGCFTAQFSTTVPNRIPPGRYEYRPILIYDVNPRLTITKPAPFVTVEVIE